ncbi:hypothetical protein TTHERM_00711859 (macronuclear) [Tetrahymena thermophila SB210]|uniref:Uncharacterized protein n=1 Tax=Tetrahymena thermophila (strain SB210) TaxID=312017 RepID=A4VCT0_TETTS|nr:hypothetical protein TTHERM_00711859 [Tetrahymena thermophila SB210]EDK31336.1 hypothetical protein TTHERM_00711859 [Tetrahymena thermophila SB210]|eukprot:XP_001471472.1 hypothetical protein TTHERM_00711859 [Tetrahymena thermophila SB210]
MNNVEFNQINYDMLRNFIAKYGNLADQLIYVRNLIAIRLNIIFQQQLFTFLKTQKSFIYFYQIQLVREQKQVKGLELSKSINMKKEILIYIQQNFMQVINYKEMQIQNFQYFYFDQDGLAN